MPKSVVLIPQLIQQASQQILPAEILDYDSLSYKQLSTWESRVLASAAASYIWTAIPPNLKRLRGSTRPSRFGGGVAPHIVKRLLREKFFRPHIDSATWTFATASAQNIFAEHILQNTRLPLLISPLQQQSQPRRRGLLGLGIAGL